MRLHEVRVRRGSGTLEKWQTTTFPAASSDRAGRLMPGVGLGILPRHDKAR